MVNKATGSATLTFPSGRETVITRVFAAPRQLVFEAWTTPEHVRRWYGLRSLAMTVCDIDLRPGGAWRYVVQAEDGSEHAFSGVYREVVPHERLFYTEGYEAMPGTNYLVTTIFDERDGKTTLTSHLLYKSKEHRDGHIASGMEPGMNETLDRLNEHLAVMANEFAVTVTHIFAAPAEQVFDAWLDPSAAGRWLFATPGGEMQRVEMDARVGGGFTVIEKRGDVLAEHFGRYVEIDRPRRLVFTFATDSAEEPSRVVIEIRPNGAGCELTLTHFMDAQWADYADRTRAGWAGILEGLDVTLTANCEIVSSRVFAAPRERVFEAFSNPNHLVHWWGPNGFTNTFQEFDLRPGGAWRFIMHGPDGAEYPMAKDFVEVVRPARIVHQHLEATHRFLMTMLFAERPNGTLLTWRMAFESAAEYAKVKPHIVLANEQNFDRLEAYLAKQDMAEREIVMTRVINAPRALVFNAWTNREHIDKWWGPDGCRNETFEMDVRPGGRWRFVMHAPNGVDYPNRIVYREVTPPERLVFDHGDDIDDDPNAFLATATFEDVDGKTRLTLRSVFKTSEQLEQTVAFGAVELGNQTLANLEKFVIKLAAETDYQKGD